MASIVLLNTISPSKLSDDLILYGHQVWEALDVSEVLYLWTGGPSLICFSDNGIHAVGARIPAWSSQGAPPRTSAARFTKQVIELRPSA